MAAVVAVGGATAWAAQATTSRGGLIHVYEVTAGNGSTGTIVISGAFADSGIDQQGIDPKGILNRIVLSRGTFEVDTRKIGAAFNKSNYKVNAKNCSVIAKATAPAPLSSGTAAYEGIRGTVTVTVTNAEVYPRLRNGKCNMRQDAQPLGSLSIVEGSGTVSFK